MDRNKNAAILKLTKETPQKAELYTGVAEG